MMLQTKNIHSWFIKEWEQVIAVDAHDEEEIRLGRLFNTLMLISVGIVTLLVIFFLLLSPLNLMPLKESLIGAAFPFFFLPFSFYCLARAKRGHVRQMINLYVWINFIALALAALVFDGIQSPAWTLYIWTITIAGSLMAPSYALSLTGTTLAYFLFLSVLSGSGIYTPLITFGHNARNFLMIAFLLTMFISTVGFLTYLNMRSLKDALARLHNTAEELRKHRDVLEQRVSDRTEELKRRVEFERLVTSLSSHFINLETHDVDTEIIQALEAIGRFRGVDRGYVFLFRDNNTILDNTHEWCAKGIEPQIDNSKGLSPDKFPYWIERLTRFESIYITHVPKLPAEENAENELLEAQSIQSIIAVPIVYQNSLVGFLGFDSVRKEELWSEDDFSLLKILGEIFINALARKEAEEALFQSEEKYRILVETTQDAIFIIQDGLIEFANGAFGEMVGYTPDEMKGLNFTSFVAPEDLEIVADRYRRRLAGEDVPSEYEFRLLHKDGKTRVDAIMNVRIVTYQGSLASMGTGKNITERKKAEDLKLRLAAIVESSDDAIIGMTPDGIITSWNQGAQKIYGYTENETIGKTISMLFLPEYRDELPRILEKLKRGEHIDQQEILRRRKGGEQIYISLAISPIRDRDGRIVGTSTIERDITARKAAENELARSRDQLEKIVKELEVFSYTISHDLRAPLWTIEGFIHLLMEKYSSKFDKKGKDYLERISKATQNMSSFIESLLKLSKVTRGALNKELVSLSEMARDVASELKIKEPKRQAEFIIPENLKVYADPHLLQAVMENLMGNAWKFSSTKTCSRIELGVIKDKDGNIYFVRDNGVGFNMDYNSKLFQPFERLHSDFPGSGIGLATVKRIIERHEGRIWAESEEEKGATFYFKLPEVN